MVVFQEVSGSSGCCCSFKTYSITGYSKKQACMGFIVSCVTLLYLVLPLLFFSLYLIQETGMLVSVMTLLGTDRHIDDHAGIRLFDTCDKKM